MDFRSRWEHWKMEQDKRLRGGGAVFWRPDPIWERLQKQASWSRLLRVLSQDGGLAVEAKYSSTSRSYRCEVFVWELVPKQQYHRNFAAEGYGDNPICAIRAALARVQTPIALSVRLALLTALVDYLLGMDE